MKPSREEREKLAGAIQRARAASALSNATIASVAKVDPGQTSRILDGDFMTFGGNVLRICNVLGVDPGAPDAPETAKEAARTAAWARLEASVRNAWDKTPQGADRLVAVIDAVGRVRPVRRRKPSVADAKSRGTRER